MAKFGEEENGEEGGGGGYERASHYRLIASVQCTKTGKWIVRIFYQYKGVSGIAEKSVLAFINIVQL